MGLAIFLALIGVPLVEIAVFIEIGGRIGLWSTLGLIVATAIVGTALLRQQGLSTLARARDSLDRGEFPVQELLDGVCLLIAGALLLTPGFVTDAGGALLLAPPVRRVLQAGALRWMVAHGSVAMSAGATGPRPPRGRGGIIEGEFVELDEDDPAAPDGRPGRR